MRALLAVVAVVVGLTVPAAPAFADDPPWLPPDNTTLPILDEVEANGVLAKQYRISVPEGASLELAVVASAVLGSNEDISLNTDWQTADGSVYYRSGTAVSFGRDHVFVTHEGDEVTRYETRVPGPTEPGGVAGWSVRENLPAGIHLVTMWSASPGGVSWSRIRLRASAGVSILNSTTSTETFLVRCRDFPAETQVSASATSITGHEDVTAVRDAAYTVAVDQGLVGKLWINGETYQEGYVVDVYTEVKTGWGGYVSPDGTDHPGRHHSIMSALTGDYTMYVDHSVANWDDCGFVTGADMAPA